MADLVRAPAKQLGRRAHAPARGPVVEHLAFRLVGETYALPLADVREILTSPPVTLVPRAAKEVVGIVSVRGQLVTVLDLAARLGLREGTPGNPPLGRKTRILLVPGPLGEIMGLLVDEVLSVYRLAEPEIEPVGVLGGNVAEYVTGIGRRDGVVLILLALAPLLGQR